MTKTKNLQLKVIGTFYTLTQVIKFSSMETKIGYGTLHVIQIDYFIESATYGFLFASCKTLENERVSAVNE